MGGEWHWSFSFRKGDKESPGCMRTVLQLFDFHHFHYAPQHHQEHQQKQNQPFHSHPLPLDPPFSEGAEAPRNSLELTGGDVLAGNSAVSEEDDIPIGIPILTAHSSSLEKDSSSETCSMKGSKTPNLVARLMGLELLPDQVCSPKIQSQPSSARLKSHQSRKPLHAQDSNFYEIGSRSLPDTPRISSARRSDVDHRLSLQLNKENVDFEDLSYSPFSSRKGGKKEVKFQHEENQQSPSRYAREIVKQVKENVIRRVGVDITNITANTRFKHSCSSESDALTFSNRKPRRPTKSSSHEISPSKNTHPSSSPRLRLSEAKSKHKEGRDQLKPSLKSQRPSPSPLPSSKMARTSPATSPSPSPSLPPLTSSSSPSAVSKECTKNKSEALPRHTVQCRKASCERFTQRHKKPSGNAEKKIKAIPIQAPPSSKSPQDIQLHWQDVDNTSDALWLRLFQKTQAAPALGLPLQLSCTSSPSYVQPQPAPLLDDPGDISSSRRTTVTVGCAELLYLREILRRTGLRTHTPVSSAAWFSPAHPLHPTLFHHLLSTPAAALLPHPCDRRLLFDLVDEILRDALRPHLSMRPWARPRPAPPKVKAMTGEQLLQLLWAQLRAFPLADCQTLEDIDSLVEKDLEANANANSNSAADWCCWCCWDEVVEAVEREIVDSVVHEEMLRMVWGPLHGD
ncbi:hypothetical protein ACLOJK_004524 [Asimina triloba]